MPRLYDAIAGPGPRPSAIARTRLIDDVIAALDARIGQVVILGAGFDSRAHRLGALTDRTVFEVDHPATQATKRAIVDRIGLGDAKVVYVAVDFERDALDARLVAEGFDPKVPSLFLWEGVTNYLTADAVDATLATIRSLGAAGSVLVFTYVHAGVLDGSADFPEARRWLKGVELSGEPWTFGFRPDEVGGYLEARGFVLESDVSTAEAGNRWFPAQRPARAGIGAVPRRRRRRCRKPADAARRGGAPRAAPSLDPRRRDHVLRPARAARCDDAGDHRRVGSERRRDLHLLPEQGRDHRRDRVRAARAASASS